MGKSTDKVRNAQTVHWDTVCSAETLFWHVGGLDIVGEPGAESCGLALLHPGGRIFAHELPTEFFNHQLMSCDASSFESLRDFVTAWGLPFSPYRYSSLGLYLIGNRAQRRDVKRACDMTDKLKSDLTPVVSLAEARHAIETLQNIVQQMRRAIRGESFEDFTAPLNAASCNDLVAGIRDGSQYVTVRKTPLGAYWETERLTSAICNQMLCALADDAPWKECACTTCDVVFKQKQTPPKPHAVAKPRTNSEYCCDTCRNTQKSRNQRKSARNRLDHGL